MYCLSHDLGLLRIFSPQPSPPLSHRHNANFFRVRRRCEMRRMPSQFALESDWAAQKGGGGN